MGEFDIKVLCDYPSSEGLRKISVETCGATCDMRRILFVCHGNICRSPMAEFILKALVKAKGISVCSSIEEQALKIC